MRTSLLLLSLCSVLGVLTGCGHGSCTRPDPLQMEMVLEEQAEAWNAGDVQRYMKGYWKSEELTFSSGGETRNGWDATLQRYLTRYPDKATMGHLTFEVEKTAMLGPDAAYMLGRWHLERDEPIGGNFSLVWQRTADGWKIVHDHTSVLESE